MWLKYGKWLAAPRQIEWFSDPRIVVREVTSKGKIYAAYIEEAFVFSNSVDGIRSRSNNKKDLLALTAILNCKLISFYHLNKSGNSRKDSFPKILVRDLREIGIPEDFSDQELACLVTISSTSKKPTPRQIPVR